MTIRINLLPRRAHGLVRQMRRFYLTLFATATGGPAILLLLTALSGEQYRAQQHLLRLLQTEHERVDLQIRKSQQLQDNIDLLNARREYLESLHARRNDAVRLLNWLTVSTPADVTMHSLTHDGRQLALNGVAISYLSLSELLAHVHASSDLFGNAEVLEMRAMETADGPSQRQRFSLRIPYAAANARTATDQLPRS